MKEILFKLNEFCGANRIEYVVTGTMALSLLGVPSSFTPQDIDIKVFHLTEEQREKLEELEFLAGLKNESYEHGQGFSFIIDGVKINALIDNTKDYNKITSQIINVSLTDEKNAKHHLFGVQLVNFALADKMKLGRDKDRAYLLNLIHNLTSLV